MWGGEELTVSFYVFLSIDPQPPLPAQASSAQSPHCTCCLEWAEVETSSPPQAEGHREVGESQEGSQGLGTGLPGSCCYEVETDPAP